MPIWKKGIYISALPVFETSHNLIRVLLSSSILDAPTYGGLPTIASNPPCCLTSSTFSHLNLRELACIRLNLYSSSSSSSNASRVSIKRVLSMLYFAISTPYRQFANIFRYGMPASCRCLASVIRKPPQPQAMSANFFSPSGPARSLKTRPTICSLIYSDV